MPSSNPNATVCQLLNAPAPSPDDPTALHQPAQNGPRLPPSCQFCGKPNCTAAFQYPTAAKIVLIVEKGLHAKHTVAESLNFSLQFLTDTFPAEDALAPSDDSLPFVPAKSTNAPLVSNPDDLSSDLPLPANQTFN